MLAYRSLSGYTPASVRLFALQELKLMLALVMRRYRLRLRHPDMLGRCTRLFPFLVPARGTDTVVLEARETTAAAA